MSVETFVINPPKISRRKIRGIRRLRKFKFLWDFLIKNNQFQEAD